MIQRKEYINKLKAYKDKQIIKVITGIRRCGKSTLLELYREYLFSEGVLKEQVISINLEEIEYHGLRDYMSLYNYIKERLQKDKQTYVFIDEVQNCTEFQRAVDSLFVKKNVDVYITGSNAYMLSGELATLLSGRYIKIEMLPLSFKEYVSATDENINLERRFRDYLRFGGFPFILQFNNNEIFINEYLDGLYNTIFLKDIVARNNIKDNMILEDVLKFTFDNIGNISTSKKISDTLTSTGRKTSQPTVESYLSHLMNSYIVYKVNRYDIKGKEYLKSLAKYYIADIGLRNYLLGYKNMDTGHILENIIYLELLRRGYKVYVGKVDSNEVDFVAMNQKDTFYIQVSETIKESTTLERELAPLKAIKDYYTRMLITNDYDVNASYNGIKHINAIDFLLGDKL
jgi:uncharacterized protein